MSESSLTPELGRNVTILIPASLRTPSSGGNAQGAVHAGLAAGHDPLYQVFHRSRGGDGIIPAVMGKAYWRIIQDEIEAEGWKVNRAVRLMPN
jgi:hypothetical protein